jgi:hypothetical protein
MSVIDQLFVESWAMEAGDGDIKPSMNGNFGFLSMKN